MRKLFLLILLSGMSQLMIAQDTLLLISGRKIIVSSVDLTGNTIAYRSGSKLKKINPERVFSIKYKSGEERIIYGPDSLDPLDFKVDEMKNFIHGELDARSLYKNHLIPITGVVIGGGSALL